MFSQIKKITKMAKKEVINKVITSLFIQGLALVIPVFWSKTITEVTEFSLLTPSFSFFLTSYSVFKYHKLLLFYLLSTISFSLLALFTI